MGLDCLTDIQAVNCLVEKSAIPYLEEAVGRPDLNQRPPEPHSGGPPLRAGSSLFPMSSWADGHFAQLWGR